MAKRKSKNRRQKGNGNKSKKNQTGNSGGEKTSQRRNRAKKHELSKDEYTAAQRELDQQLKGMGLYCKEIAGDGNCLFRSLSDQLYGNTKYHSKIRKEICEYLEEKREHFQMFVEDDNTFDYHLSQMKKDATYGGNMELVAFAQLNSLNIKIYQPNTIFVIRGDESKSLEDSGQINTLHIAYHNWEHYSSVRKIEGPHEGNPEMTIEPTNTPPTNASPANNSTPDLLPNSIEKVIMHSTGENDISKIRTLMEKLNSDENKVIDELLEEKQPKKIDETNNEHDKEIVKDKSEMENHDNLESTPKDYLQNEKELNSKSSVLGDNNIEEKTEQKDDEKVKEEEKEKEDDEKENNEVKEKIENEEMVEKEEDMKEDGMKIESPLEENHKSSQEKSNKKNSIDYSSNSEKDEEKKVFYDSQPISRKKKRRDKKHTKLPKNKKFHYQNSNPITSNNDNNNNHSPMTQLYI